MTCCCGSEKPCGMKKEKRKTSMWAFPPRRERTTKDGMRVRKALLIKMNEHLSGPLCRRGRRGSLSPPLPQEHGALGVKRDPDTLLHKAISKPNCLATDISYFLLAHLFMLIM